MDFRDSAADGPGTAQRRSSELLQYARQTVRHGCALGADLLLQQRLVETFIDAEVQRLFELRGRWMAETEQPITYQETQLDLWRRETARRFLEAVRDILGPYALLDARDPRAPRGGRFEVEQRRVLLTLGVDGPEDDPHAEMARALGLSGDAIPCPGNGR